MSSVLPVIIQSETINDNIEEEVKDEELYDEEGDDTDHEEPLPPKASVPQEEVFKEPEPPKKKKRVITDAQREHLAKARLKAAEVRKRKTQEKKLRLAQEKRAEEKLRKEVAPKQRPKKTVTKETVLHNPMESDEEEDPPIEVSKNKKAISFDDIDPELMAKISSMAVEKYDVKRKARKQEKINKQKEVAEEQKVYKSVSEAINPPMDDFYAQCFQ